MAGKSKTGKTKAKPESATATAPDKGTAATAGWRSILKVHPAADPKPPSAPAPETMPDLPRGLDRRVHGLVR